MEPDKKVMDFFKTKTNLEKEPNAIVKVSAMTLYTFYSLLSRMKLQHFAAVMAMILASVLTGNYVYHTEQRLEIEKQNNLFKNQQISLKAEKDTAQAQKDKLEKDAQDAGRQMQERERSKEQLELVKRIKPEEMDAIKSHIMKTRDKEINKLKEVYWTYVFIANHDARIDFGEVNKNIRQQMNIVNEFYNFRLLELSSTYEYVKNDKPQLILPTYDGASTLDKLMVWANLTKNQQYTYLESTDEMIVKSTLLLRSPTKLGQYLKENKEMIENNPMFVNP